MGFVPRELHGISLCSPIQPIPLHAVPCLPPSALAVYAATVLTQHGKVVIVSESSIIQHSQCKNVFGMTYCDLLKISSTSSTSNIPATSAAISSCIRSFDFVIPS